jgi:hypothetical protein
MAMAATVAILALAIFLSGAALGVLVLVAVGVRTGGRGRYIPRAAHTPMEAITHRLLGLGVRGLPDGEDEEG